MATNVNANTYIDTILIYLYMCVILVSVNISE